MFDDIKTHTAELQAAASADETEFDAMRNGSTPIDQGFSDELISGEVMHLAIGADSTTSVAWEDLDQATDEGASDISTEVNRRARQMGDAYPFAIKGSSLKYHKSFLGIYEFCLAISQAPSIVSKPFYRLPRNFERLTASVFQHYIGLDATSFRFGTPTDEDDPADHPTTIFDRLSALRTRNGSSPTPFNEWIPDSGADLEAELARANDLGIDVVVWRDPPDGRAGGMTFIGQCACGKTDLSFSSKAGALRIETLRNHFHPLTSTEPIKFYAFPYHLPSEAKMRAISPVAGLMIDRGRLCTMAALADVKSALQAQQWDKRLAELTKIVTDQT